MDIDILNAILKKKKVKRTDIADVLGVSRQSITAKMSGKTDLKISELTKIFEHFKFTDEEKKKVVGIY